MHLRNSKPLSQIIQSILLLAGSFIFAFLLGEFVHDSGHYLCHLAYGNTQVGVHYDPFGGTRILGAGGLPDDILAVTSAAGPLPHILLALACFFIVWKWRRPILLPLLLWGPVAMIQEGVNFSLGLLTPGGDAVWISTLGIPQPIILAAGIVLLAGGVAGVALLLPLAGVNSEDPAWYKFAILLAGMGSLMLIRLFHSLFIDPSSTLENLVPFVFSVLLAVFVVILNPLIIRYRQLANSSEAVSIPWSASVAAFLAGFGMFLVQIYVLS
jgi:hypothetical protein